MPDESGIEINPTEVCYRAFELMQSKQLDDAERLLTSSMSKVSDNVAVGLFHSALGILYKLKGEFKTAWKHYQRAEKLIPDDPALKIIMARLLIDEFTEYDLAMKKAKKAFDAAGKNPVFAHQVYVTLGLAHLGKNEKKKAVEMLVKAMEHGFHGFVTAQNIDFALVERLLRQNLGAAECRKFLESALAFARGVREPTWVGVIEHLLSSLP
jgi:tetratricopeptide (TPR) repeat protein